MKKLFYATAFGATLAAMTPLVARAQATPPTPSAVLQAPRMPRAPMNPRAMQRRDALAAQVLQRFVNKASLEMQLDANQRGQLATVVQNSAARRNQLNQRTNALHRQFAEAIRNQDTPQNQFGQLLNAHAALRREEQQIADDEQRDLQKFLTPRQQAHFLMLWIKLQENARAIQQQIPDVPQGPPGS